VFVCEGDAEFVRFDSPIYDYGFTFGELSDINTEWEKSSPTGNHRVQISWLHAKLAVSASALLKQFEKHIVRRFTSLKTRSTAFRFPCFSYLKSKPCRWHAACNDLEPSTRHTAQSTSCFSLISVRKECAGTFVVVGLSFVCSNLLVSGSTAAYSKYCSSLSRITVSSTATWSGKCPPSGCK